MFVMWNILKQIEPVNEGFAMTFLSAKETGIRWGISPRRVAVMCKAGRVEGAQFVAGAWIIPEGAVKPADARIKSGEYIKTGPKGANCDKS